MGNYLPAWSKKLSDEMVLFALQKMAVGVATNQVARDIEAKYQVKISDVRLRAIRDTKKWSAVYNEMKRKYLAELSDLTGIEIVSAKNRLQKIQNLLEEAEKSTDFKGLKDKISTILSCLKAAKDETKQEASNQKVQAEVSFKSFMTQLAQSNQPKEVDVEIQPEPEVKE